jgi:hypothetical protein
MHYPNTVGLACIYSCATDCYIVIGKESVNFSPVDAAGG